LLLAHLDGDLVASGSLPLTATVTYTTGVFGQAVEIGQGSVLAYTGTGHFAEGEGGLDFWVRPQWEGMTSTEHVFFAAGDGKSYLFQVGTVSGYLYSWITNFDGYHELALWAEVMNWQPGEWHHVGISWMYHWLKLYVDGEMADVASFRRPITGTLGAIYLGSSVDGSSPAQAALDEVRISSRARVGNSDRVRLLVSEGQLGRIKILDLMGNLLSVWSDAESSAQWYGSHAWWPGGGGRCW